MNEKIENILNELKNIQKIVEENDFLNIVKNIEKNLSADYVESFTYPEFKKLISPMTLEEFKKIYKKIPFFLGIRDSYFQERIYVEKYLFQHSIKKLELLLNSDFLSDKNIDNILSDLKLIETKFDELIQDFKNKYNYEEFSFVLDRILEDFLEDVCDRIY